jgi:hypothetical protein
MAGVSKDGSSSVLPKPTPAQPGSGDAAMKKEPSGIDRHVADADKKARTARAREVVRDTPPAGHWNDTSAD